MTGAVTQDDKDIVTLLSRSSGSMRHGYQGEGERERGGGGNEKEETTETRGRRDGEEREMKDKLIGKQA